MDIETNNNTIEQMLNFQQQLIALQLQAEANGVERDKIQSLLEELEDLQAKLDQFKSRA